MKNNLPEISLDKATARLNTLVRFARWAEAKEQSKLVRELSSQCRDPLTLAKATEALKGFSQKGGALSQIRFLLVDLLLIGLLVAPFVYFGEWCLVAPDLTIFLFLGGAALVAVLSATQRGNVFLADSRFGRMLSNSSFRFTWFT